MIKEKIVEVDTLLKLDVGNPSYINLKNELVHELAKSELKINILQERVSILNQIAEQLISNVGNGKEIKYNLSKMNMVTDLSINVVEQSLQELKNKLELEVDKYEKVVFKIDSFVSRLSEEISKKREIGGDFQK
ncbi:conjugative relaxase-related protein [Streptococcus intermedius]|uniref:helical hairpin domain-containing protein n=1 Tax=Streptococcus intermedius TaxID=1338 RepID=UPI002001D8A3|nr:helical hairpin domain-containing protein [Streptococcus intermedius]MDK8090400.1 conjugative relaxase-related protein [Streptococcus intermedius]